MTLILALGNNDQVIQISDRRLSCDGEIVDDESNKCGVLFCLNARMAFGYTGLARWRNFCTPKWLLKALHDSAEPDYTIGEILERLKLNATDTFKTHPDLRTAKMVDKRLSVMFSGYIYPDGNVKQGCAILSNYHNFENNTAFPEATEEFRVHYSSAKIDADWPTLIQRVGNWHAITDTDIDGFREMLLSKKPASALIGKATEVIYDISDRPKSRCTIGKQLTSITVPRDCSINVDCGYYSSYTKPETYMPALVYLLPGQHLTVENIKIEPVEEDTPPLSVPKVHRNHPCPCGSNLKYRHCHGKPKSSR